LDSAEERAQKAEESAANEGRSKEECREDLQSVLLWLTNGHSCPPPELKTSSIPDIVCCGEEYRGQLSTALSELTAKDQHILQLEENISNLESQLADKEKRAREERQHVEKDISELKSKLYSTEESRERLGQELSALKTKEEQLVKAISILKEKVEPLQNEADLKGKDLQVVREALSEEQNKMSSLEREYRDQEREWNDKLEEQALLKEGLQAKLEEQNAALAKLLGEREELQGKVKRSVEELNHLKRTIQEQNCARGVIEGELSAQEGLTKDLLQKKDKADKMIAALRNQVAEREALLKSLMRSLHGLSQQVGGIKEGDSPDDVIQKHADELEDSLSEVFEDIENLRKKWIETNRAVLEGESTLEGLRETQQSLNDEIDSLRRRTADLDLLLKDKNDEAAVLQGTIQQLQSDLACCRGNYDRVIEEKNLVEQELSGLHDNTLEQCKFLQEQLNRREQTLEDLTQQQEGLQEEYTKCCQDISTKQRAIQTLEDVLREKGEEIRVLTCELETASVDKESLQEDLQRCKVLVDSLHKEMVQKESDNLQDVKVITSDYESLQNEYAAVQDMLQEREKLMEDLRSSTKHLEKKRKKAESEVARHRDTINSLEDKLNEAQTNFDHLKSQVSVVEVTS
jgi:chromosome segregation ATPase